MCFGCFFCLMCFFFLNVCGMLWFPSLESVWCLFGIFWMSFGMDLEVFCCLWSGGKVSCKVVVAKPLQKLWWHSCAFKSVMSWCEQVSFFQNCIKQKMESTETDPKILHLACLFVYHHLSIDYSSLKMRRPCCVRHPALDSQVRS